MKKVFVFGYYGFGNLGDEATLDSIIQLIRKVEPTTKISVLSYNSEHTKELYGVEGVSRNKFGSILKAIWKTDLVISGGGTLLQDVTSRRSLIYYLSLIFISKLFKKEVVFLSNGFGPVSNYQKLTRIICERVDEIILRDSDSKKKMEHIGIKKEITVTSDLTLLLPTNSGPSDYHKKVAISLRPWKVKNNFYKEMTDFVSFLLKEGYSIDLISMEKNADDKILNPIYHKFKKSSNIQLVVPKNHQEILKVISTSKILVGMRLHANIFSLMHHRPILALDYDPKVRALARDFHQICLPLDENLTSYQLIEKFKDIENDYEVYVKQIQEVLKEKKNLLIYNEEFLIKKLK